MKPMLVLVTSESCPACKAFKTRVWPRLGMYLRKDPRFDVTEVHVVKNFLEIRKVHTDLEKFVRWFPTLIMFTGASWVSTSLKGKVLNGDFVGDRITLLSKISGREREMVLLEHKRIYAWIENVLNLSEFRSERPAVVITDDTVSGSRGGTLDIFSNGTSKSMYNSETEFVENGDEYI